MTKSAWARGLGVAGLSCSMWLTGCANFFVNPGTGSGTGTGGSTGDYVYVVNANNTLSQFAVGTAKLTAISGSPITLADGLSATSVAVTRKNGFVFVGGNGAIECYSVGSNGALSATTAGGGTATANFVSLETSPDGQWLFGLDALIPAAPVLYVFSINATTGALALAGSAGVPLPVPGGGAAAPHMVKISQNGSFVAVMLGAGGDVFYNFATTTGVLTQAGALKTNGYEDDSILFDKTSGFAFIGRYGLKANTSTIVSYSVSADGILSSIGSVASGDVPYSMALDSTNTYLYAANRGSSDVSGYAVAAGLLTAASGSPYIAGTAVSAIARDSTGAYLVAAATGGSSDLTLYSFDGTTAGKLDTAASVVNGSGVAGSIAVAATHSTTADF